jgi:hypothetical protein
MPARDNEMPTRDNEMPTRDNEMPTRDNPNAQSAKLESSLEATDATPNNAERETRHE